MLLGIDFNLPPSLTQIVTVTEVKSSRFLAFLNTTLRKLIWKDLAHLVWQLQRGRATGLYESEKKLTEKFRP